MFLGAALLETGRRAEAEGAKLADEYVAGYAPHWTMNFTGISYYYQALSRLERGEREAGLGLLCKAFEHDRCPRLADAVEKHAGTRPPLEDPPSSCSTGNDECATRGSWGASISGTPWPR